MNNQKAARELPPPTYTEQEAWLIDHKVTGIKTSYKMITADSSQDYITLTDDYSKKSVTWQIETFRRIAKLADYVSNTSSLVVPVEYGLADRIRKRREWEKKEARDLAEYRRLQEKFDPPRPTQERSEP